LIASSPAGLAWDQLASFVTGSKLSLLCISEVEQIEAGVKNNYSSQKNKGLTMKEEKDLPPSP
jgi:hypothetical protein